MENELIMETRMLNALVPSFVVDRLRSNLSYVLNIFSRFSPLNLFFLPIRAGESHIAKFHSDATVLFVYLPDFHRYLSVFGVDCTIEWYIYPELKCSR